MRVCLVTLDFAPFRSSGLTIYAENLARGLAERGHQVTVIAADRSQSHRVDDVPIPSGIRVLRMPIGRLDWIGLGWQAARYLRSRCADFDVVHFADVHFAYAFRSPFVASAFQSFRQRLTSHHGRPYHTGWRNYIFRRLYYSVARQVMECPSLRRARHLLMSSQATQREFVRHYRVDPSRTTVVYLGIDLKRFQALPEQKKARRQLGLPLDVPILLYVGFSTPRKGVEYLAQALRAVDRSLYLVMVGQWERGYQRRFLEALGDAQSRVRLTGYVPDTEKPIYFAAADIFVLPTLLEGFGIPLVEAMAAGLPIVTTSAGATGEVVGDAGLVVPPGDSQAFASALERLLAEPALAEQLRQMGPARARECFDLYDMAARVEEIYRLSSQQADRSQAFSSDPVIGYKDGDGRCLPVMRRDPQLESSS
ncbi:MAG: glycosyltransferase family 4 protein [Anaerolineae bacterium]|nr:glycosyltransferase family 4 protein [Anaerolineae bacterium]MDW8099848.1 glycosyltransferase family 4 protein [Anaerolineae bacterium]